MHLQKRLLSKSSASEDVEKLMISKLKSECGFQFTSKLEGMFNDLRVSQDVMRAYRAAKRDGALPLPTGSTAAACAAVDLDVTILTTVNWPGAKSKPVPLPPEVAAAAEQFRVHYLASHSGRKLTWHTEKGTADLLFQAAPDRKHEITVSTWQMCVLLLLNGPGPSPGVTFAEMQEALGGGVPRDELVRHVLSLATPRLRLLNKSSKGKDVEAADVFSINPDFSSKFYRIRVPLISMKSAGGAGDGGGPGGAGGGAGGGPSAYAADEEGGDIMLQVENQRKNMIDASIVRIMKSRKTMDHTNLVAEVVRQLSARFLPAPPDIKKRIENLIEREYLERDKDDKKLYNYLA
jgi:cullin 3